MISRAVVYNRYDKDGDLIKTLFSIKKAVAAALPEIVDSEIAGDITGFFSVKVFDAVVYGEINSKGCGTR